MNTNCWPSASSSSSSAPSFSSSSSSSSITTDTGVVLLAPATGGPDAGLFLSLFPAFAAFDSYMSPLLGAIVTAADANTKRTGMAPGGMFPSDLLGHVYAYARTSNFVTMAGGTAKTIQTAAPAAAEEESREGEREAGEEEGADDGGYHLHHHHAIHPARYRVRRGPGGVRVGRASTRRRFGADDGGGDGSDSFGNCDDATHPYQSLQIHDYVHRQLAESSSFLIEAQPSHISYELVWNDQGWGNTKGELLLTLERADGTTSPYANYLAQFVAEHAAKHTADDCHECMADHAVDGQWGCANDKCRGRRYCIASCSKCKSMRAKTPNDHRLCSGTHAKTNCDSTSCASQWYCHRNCTACPDIEKQRVWDAEKIAGRQWTQLAMYSLAGIAPHTEATVTREIDRTHPIIALARVDGRHHYRMHYRVGGGGGHSLHIHKLRIDFFM